MCYRCAPDNTPSSLKQRLHYLHHLRMMHTAPAFCSYHTCHNKIYHVFVDMLACSLANWALKKLRPISSTNPSIWLGKTVTKHNFHVFQHADTAGFLLLLGVFLYVWVTLFSMFPEWWRTELIFFNDCWVSQFRWLNEVCFLFVLMKYYIYLTKIEMMTAGHSRTRTRNLTSLWC